MEALIALGSNLGDKQTLLERAINELSLAIGPILAKSSFWETEPEFPKNTTIERQPNFINAVVVCQTALAADQILDNLLQIENKLGRIRTVGKRYQARTIDLDLLGLDSQVINQSNLVLPHPELHKRSFVLGPLFEIRSAWKHPLLEKSVAELWSQLKK